jgi:hypothetical protein
VARPINQPSDVGAFQYSTVPTVTTNPSDRITHAGNTVPFTAAASTGQPMPVTVQWQVSTNGGSTFSDLSNAVLSSEFTTTTLTVFGVTAGMDGYKYRAVFTNAAGLTAMTSAATLTITTANTAPTMSTVSSPQTVAHGTISTTINLNISDAEYDSVTATVTLTDPIYTNVSSVYGLHSAELTQYYNYRGAREKYFVSSNGSNPAGGGYYVLMPTNKLYAWAGTLAATLAQSPVADFTSSTYATVDVYANPALMTSNTGTPLVTVDNPLYDLKVKYGLNTAAQYFNYRGANEWYLRSNNGSNPNGGGWYLLLPNNTLVAWNNSISNYTLVADLASYGSVYATPTLLTSAKPVTAVGVTASISPNPIPFSSQPGGTLTITPTAGFERSVNVTVNVTDGFVATPVTQSFTYKVTNTAPIMSAIADRPITHNNATDSFNVSGNVSDPGDASTRVYGVEVSGYGSSYPLDQVAGQYGLNTANQYTDYRGQGETYFLSSNNSNAGNGGWYVLTSDSKLYAWAGSMSASTTGGTSSPYFVADFMTAFYGMQNVSATPSLLYNARKPSAPAVNVNRGPLYDVKVQYGLDTADQSYNYRGQSEKYFHSSNGSNPAAGGYYVLMPDGKLYAWDGVSLNSTTSGGSSSAYFVADLGTTNAYSNPSLLYQAQAIFVNDANYDAKYRYGLYTADLPAYANYRGQGEKYLHSGNGSNPANGGWYVLIANGGNTELRAWNGVSLNTSPVVTTFSGLSVLNNPYLLYASTGQALGVTATVDGSGQVTLTRDAAFAGSVRVAVTASDGAEQASQIFKSTVTDNAPTPPTIDNVSAAGGTGATVPFATAASDADGDTLSFRALISDNPLYLLKTQYGLNTADQFFNYPLQNEKYFHSSNGSNPAGGGYYVLTTGNRLYAWDGISYNTTVAQAPVADFTSSYYGNAPVYSTTSLLYNATTTPNLSQIGTANLTAGSMDLTWPSGFTGKFLVTFYASDGAKETEWIFLATVT